MCEAGAAQRFQNARAGAMDISAWLQRPRGPPAAFTVHLARRSAGWRGPIRRSPSLYAETNVGGDFREATPLACDG